MRGHTSRTHAVGGQSRLDLGDENVPPRLNMFELLQRLRVRRMLHGSGLRVVAVQPRLQRAEEVHNLHVGTEAVDKSTRE